jgi:aspartate ammonia-lyase
MGAGTAFHMNVNEVLANRANEILGSPKGSYAPIHPNDHVNMSQSTNDVFPTAMRMAALMILRERLHEPLAALAQSFFRKGKEWDDVLKSARTHLQDAVPIRLGQEFTAYGEALKKSGLSLHAAAEALTELGIGGSAAGTGINTTAVYRTTIMEELSRLTGFRLKAAPNLCEAMQSQRPIAEISASLRNLSLEIIRIANDLRLLASGPETGLAEIRLPAQAPGSSIMPGKVNPSILEMVNMVTFQVIGCDTVIAYAVSAGQLELNVMMPVMAFNLNFAITILGNALKILGEKCIDGITVNKQKCRYYAERSPGLATALNPILGYARAAEITQEALASGKSILEIIREKKILSEDQIREILDPFKMTNPGR